MERVGAPHDDRRGEGERDPLPVVELERGTIAITSTGKVSSDDIDQPACSERNFRSAVVTFAALSEGVDLGIG